MQKKLAYKLIIACFIYFTAEISVMGRTEISVSTQYTPLWKFVYAELHKFLSKADETSFWLRICAKYFVYSLKNPPIREN